MSFDPIYEKYGVIKIEGTKVKLFKDYLLYYSVEVGSPVSHALWSSGVLIVYLMNGEARRYRNGYLYETIR